MKREKQKEREERVNGEAQGATDLSVQNMIARRAYELYLERGGVSRNEIDDWLQAEREILSGQAR